jgi:fatty-acyl-CoA synthase
VNLDIAAVRAALTPERPAVHWRGRWYDYAEMNERANRLAARLHALGLRRFDRVTILAPNHLAHLDLVLATAKAGVVYAPVNHRLSQTEQRAVFQVLRPKLLLHDAANAEGAAAAGAPTVALDDYEVWLGDHAAAPDPALGPEDPQMILLTGGTTGLPKGAVLPYRQIVFNAINTVLSWGLRDDDCVIQATPCFHAAVNVFTTPLYHLGGRVVLAERFEPGEYLATAQELGATIAFMVPTMFAMLGEHPDFVGADLSRVRWAISGGAPCPDPVRERFARRGVRFRQGYGLTEAGVNCFAITPEAAERKPWSVGRPVLHARAEVRRPDGSVCPPDEIGELTLHGPHVFSGYFEQHDETAAVLQSGWLSTGDLARVDADGDFAIVGRRKEMFISGGENVYPIEIETVCYDHPDVAECAVVGVDDARWGEVGLLVVAPHEGGEIDPADVVAFLRARLAGYKVPKHVRVLGELPKSAAGKTLRRALRDAFVAEAAADHDTRPAVGER